MRRQRLAACAVTAGRGNLLLLTSGHVLGTLAAECTQASPVLAQSAHHPLKSHALHIKSKGMPEAA